MIQIQHICQVLNTWPFLKHDIMHLSCTDTMRRGVSELSSSLAHAQDQLFYRLNQIFSYYSQSMCSFFCFCFQSSNFLDGSKYIDNFIIRSNLTDQVLNLVYRCYISFKKCTVEESGILFIWLTNTYEWFHSCKWEREECQNFTISSEFTDKGFCHTFNGDEALMLYSKRTGGSIHFFFLQCNGIIILIVFR